MGTAADTWGLVRERVLARDGNRCTVGWLLGGECDDPLHVHHIVPRAEGGGDDLDNLISVCGRHHPMVEALRRALLYRRGWRRCTHHHPYPGGREACERRLNQAA